MNVELIIIKWGFAVWTSPLETCRRVVFKFARGHHWKSLSMVKLSCRLVSLYILPYCIHRRKITLLSCHWHSPRRIFNSFFFIFQIWAWTREDSSSHAVLQLERLNVFLIWLFPSSLRAQVRRKFSTAHLLFSWNFSSIWQNLLSLDIGWPSSFSPPRAFSKKQVVTII